MKRELENRLGVILAWGTLAITVLVTDKINTDPVNVSKMLLLAVVGFSVLPIIFMHWRNLLRDNRIVLLSSIGFILFATVSMFTSTNPIERGLYGAFGRNTGLLTYTSLVFIFLTSTLVSQDKTFRRVIKALLTAGVVNIILSLFAAAGKDLLTWDNPYNAVLGTLGNPNFISSFMGIFLTLLIVQILDQNVSTRLKLVFLGLIPFAVLTIYFARSLQGILVAAFGLILATYFFIRSKPAFFGVSHLYLGGVVIGGFLVLAGILNKGPLAGPLYSYTVNLRGEYWKAGINMGLARPFSGVGIDSYGIYYRSFRELSATVVPGVDVGTDTAHNVYIDIFSGTGFPGLVALLIINGFVLFTALKYLKANKAFDGRFLTLFLCWAAYQLQSIASINQIGLAVWGWLLGGLILAYTRSSLSGKLEVKKSEPKANGSRNRSKALDDQLLDASSSMKILTSAVIGLLIALPPFIVDAKMRSFFSNKKGTIESIVALGQSWPVDNLRLNRIIISLGDNNLNDDARELASFSALKFPNDYVSWRALYELTRDGIPEKEFIRKQLHQIDPFNPTFFEK